MEYQQGYLKMRITDRLTGKNIINSNKIQQQQHTSTVTTSANCATTILKMQQPV
jgi:hypothetical protein